MGEESPQNIDLLDGTSELFARAVPSHVFGEHLPCTALAGDPTQPPRRGPTSPATPGDAAHGHSLSVCIKKNQETYLLPWPAGLDSSQPAMETQQKWLQPNLAGLETLPISW